MTALDTVGAMVTGIGNVSIANSPRHSQDKPEKAKPYQSIFESTAFADKVSSLLKADLEVWVVTEKSAHPSDNSSESSSCTSETSRRDPQSNLEDNLLKTILHAAQEVQDFAENFFLFLLSRVWLRNGYIFYLGPHSHHQNLLRSRGPMYQGFLMPLPSKRIDSALLIWEMKGSSQNGKL